MKYNITRTVVLSVVSFSLLGSGVLRGIEHDEDSVRKAVASEQDRAGVAKREVQRVLGAAMASLEGTVEGRKFTGEVVASAKLVDDLLCSGPLPKDTAKMMRILFELWKTSKGQWGNDLDRRMAVAVAMTFAQDQWPEDKAMLRYQYYTDSWKKGLLNKDYGDWDAWEMRFLASAGQNGGWGTWDDAAMEWLRDQVKLPAQDYIGACWQAPYHLENVFGDSIHGSMYYAPFSHMNHAQRVRDIGGVCGSLSHYGATAARANGILALTMGEPGHCAYAVRVKRGDWQPAYSLSWQRGLHTSLWGKTWTQLVLQEKVLGDRQAYKRSMAHVWQAHLVMDTDRELAELCYQLALEEQPLNLPIWMEAIEYFKNKEKKGGMDWRGVSRGACKALADYPEAAWQVVSAVMPKVLVGMDVATKQEYLLEFQKVLSEHPGPIMWDIAGVLNQQLAALGGDVTQQLDFYEKVLAMQAGSKQWFAPTIAWGQEKFGKNEATVGQYFQVLSKAFAVTGANGDLDGLKSALRPAVLAAEASQQVDAFQALGKAGAALRKDGNIEKEPFAGELLSSGGLVQVSSTCQWDSPENHWGLLERCGGGFHTDSQVRPYVIARLGKLGDVSGIVVQDHAAGTQNAGRNIPYIVEISEDGKQWSQVFRNESSQREVRIPLEGKATRVQYVRVMRDDDRKEYFHLNAIHVYGRRLQ